MEKSAVGAIKFDKEAPFATRVLILESRWPLHTKETLAVGVYA